MVRVVLIRHGATAGNLQKRYIGCTDEPLTAASREILSRRRYPEADALFVSPMLRCRETAELLYPGMPFSVCEPLREIDFGRFEGKNYAELNGDPDYQAWLDSNATLPFPGGEDTADFKQRCCAEFERIVTREGFAGKTLAFVVHGGTIMSVLERFSDPPSGFYDWQLANGEAYCAEYVGGRLTAIHPCATAQKEATLC